MITYDMTENAKDCIISKWGNINGKKVIDECSKVAPFNGNSGKFLDHCTAAGIGPVCFYLVSALFIQMCGKQFRIKWALLPGKVYVACLFFVEQIRVNNG